MFLCAILTENKCRNSGLICPSFFLLIDKERGIDYFTGDEEIKFLTYEEIKEEAKLNTEREVR